MPHGRSAGAGAGSPTMVSLPPLLVPPSESRMTTVLAIISVDGLGSTVTANRRVRVTLGGRSATALLQTVPAGLPSAQDQPGLLAPVLKVVAIGTVSVITTPVAVLPPTLP